MYEDDRAMVTRRRSLLANSLPELEKIEKNFASDIAEVDESSI